MLPGIAGIGGFTGGAPASAGHRYWFLTITQTGSANQHEVQEIEWLDAGGSVVAATGGSAFDGGAGSVGDPASRAFDGTSNSWFRNTSGSVFIGYDFGSGNLKNIAKVRITGSPNNCLRSPEIWDLRYADTLPTSVSDGTVVLSGKSRYWVRSEPRTFPEVLAAGVHRIWALFLDTNNGGSWNALGEIEFRDTPGGTDQTPALSDNFSNTTGRPIGGYITSGNEEGYRAFDNNFGNYYASYVAPNVAGNNWIGCVKPGGYVCGEVSLTAGIFPTWAPRSTRLCYYDEATSAFVQVGSAYDWGSWSTTATRTHSF